MKTKDWFYVFLVFCIFFCIGMAGLTAGSLVANIFIPPVMEAQDRLHQQEVEDAKIVDAITCHWSSRSLACFCVSSSRNGKFLTWAPDGVCSRVSK